jgi:hypothetical protein
MTLKLKSSFRKGDLIRVARIPEAVEQMPLETRTIFREAQGKTFVVQGFGRYGHLELDVSRVRKRNFIWIEPDCVQLVRRAPSKRKITR